MLAEKVFDYIVDTVENLGSEKKITISYVKPNGENESTIELKGLDIQCGNLYVNEKMIRDQEIEQVDHVVSVGNGELNIQLWTSKKESRMTDVDGYKRTIEDFIEEVNQVQEEENAMGLSININDIFEMWSIDAMKEYDGDLVFIRDDLEVAKIPQRRFKDCTYMICIDDDLKGITIEFKM